MLHIPFGTYSVVVVIVDGQEQSLGQSVVQDLTFDAACDLIVSDSCAKTLSVEVSLF